MKKRREGKYLGEEVEDRNEVGDRNWVLVGRGGQKQSGGGGGQTVGVNSHSSSLHGAKMILLTPEL